MKVVFDAAEGVVDSGTTPTINRECPLNGFDYRSPRVVLNNRPVTRIDLISV